VDGNRGRLQKRAASFVREYASAPGILREALTAGDYPRLQSLAHNLKSSAAYVGAVELATAASRVEHELRTGQLDRIGVLLPVMVGAAETVLAGLSRVAAPVLPGSAEPDALATVLARLERYLRSDDARAEDALAQLELMLVAGVDTGALSAPMAALRRAVSEIEYAAALAPLAEVAMQLEAAPADR